MNQMICLDDEDMNPKMLKYKTVYTSPVFTSGLTIQSTCNIMHDKKIYVAIGGNNSVDLANCRMSIFIGLFWILTKNKTSKIFITAERLISKNLEDTNHSRLKKSPH